MILAPPSSVQTDMNRILVIASSVVVFHIAALWALQSGLLRRVAEVVVPVEILGDLITPPAPKVDLPSPRTPKIPAPQPRQFAPRPAAQPAPQPLAIADQTPTPSAPVGVLMPQPPAPPIGTAVAVTPASPFGPPAPTRVELPSTDADYLNNPRPAYPPMSKRMGEQGKVVVRVLIGADGLPQKAEIRTSSSYERLDQAALATVMKWRYVPGKRAGVPEAMWFNVPINFVLE
jgi:protein TonB